MLMEHDDGFPSVEDLSQPVADGNVAVLPAEYDAGPPAQPTGYAAVVQQMPPAVAQEIIVPQRSGSEIAREIIETLLLTLLIFWVVNTITGRFRIEGSSMLPTMHEGEYVLINKLSYYLSEPEHGDIIVLHYPRDPSRDFIKRVIALPGDTVEVTNEQVRINGTLLTEPYISAPPAYTGTWTVPPDQYFVLGDNRNNSSDSHNWGFVPHENIVGKGWVVYWPLNAMERVPHYSHTINAPTAASSR